MNITENNKLISDFLVKKALVAEFPHFAYVTTSGDFKTEFLPNEMKFHKDCNWLQEVVNKIESLGYWLNRINGDVYIVNNEGEIVVNNPMHEDSNAIYLIVVDFIKWYNDTQNAS